MAPLFSIVTPVFNPPAQALRDTIRSVRKQTFTDWEWCIVDDQSTQPQTWSILERAARQDSRIRIARRSENGGISRASNDAIAMATGEFLVFLDHDDLLVPQALEAVALRVRAQELDFVYSDEAVLHDDGLTLSPFYKPDWSPARMLCQMYTCHLGVMRRTLVDELGGFRPAFDGSQDYDLVLRVTEQTDRIQHIPEVLYLWRSVPGSAAAAPSEKKWAYEAGRRAVQAHFDRCGIRAQVQATKTPGVYRSVRELQGERLVSIIIPSRGSRGRVFGDDRVHLLHSLRSIMERTTYPNFEIVLVVDRSTPDFVMEESRWIAGDRLRVVWFDAPFNFSAKINAGVAQSAGDVLVLLNDDTEVISPDWLQEFVGLTAITDVGLVGAKLYFADGSIQHAGISCRGHAPHPIYRGYEGTGGGHVAFLDVEREVVGNTAACCAFRRELWDEVGGMCEALPNSFNDVDFSLKFRAAGYRNVWSPHIELYHFESMTRDSEVRAWEIAWMSDRWGDAMCVDPYFNPNLDLGCAGFVVNSAQPYLRDLRWKALV
ncbi:MAG: glycosyltransferase family 2 protein [Acidimicrobiia bacterium]